jgi:hypothetical protein
MSMIVTNVHALMGRRYVVHERERYYLKAGAPVEEYEWVTMRPVGANKVVVRRYLQAGPWWVTREGRKIGVATK